MGRAKRSFGFVRVAIFRVLSAAAYRDKFWLLDDVVLLLNREYKLSGSILFTKEQIRSAVKALRSDPIGDSFQISWVEGCYVSPKHSWQNTLPVNILGNKTLDGGRPIGIGWFERGAYGGGHPSVDDLGAVSSTKVKALRIDLDESVLIKNGIADDIIFTAKQSKSRQWTADDQAKHERALARALVDDGDDTSADDNEDEAACDDEEGDTSSEGTGRASSCSATPPVPSSSSGSAESAACAEISPDDSAATASGTQPPASLSSAARKRTREDGGSELSVLNIIRLNGKYYSIPSAAEAAMSALIEQRGFEEIDPSIAVDEESCSKRMKQQDQRDDQEEHRDAQVQSEIFARSVDTQTLKRPLEWDSAMELLEVLEKRKKDAPLKEEEERVLKALAEYKTEPTGELRIKNDRGQNRILFVLLPPIRGERSQQEYNRLRLKKASAKEVALLLENVCRQNALPVIDVVSRLAKSLNITLYEHKSEEQRRKATNLILNMVSDRTFHEIRMIALNTMCLPEFGIPLTRVSAHRSLSCSGIYKAIHASWEMEVGKNKRMVVCHSWQFELPLDVYSAEIASQKSRSNRFVPASDFSRAAKDKIIFLFSIDKGGDRTAAYGRSANVVGGNSARDAILFALMGDNASECRTNLLKWIFNFKEEYHPVGQMFQDMLDDAIVSLTLCIDDGAGDTVLAVASIIDRHTEVNHFDIDTSHFPAADMREIVVIERKYYTSTRLPVESNEDASNLALLRDADSRAIIALAQIENEDPVRWVSFGAAAHNVEDGKIVSSEWERNVGIEDDDAKMTSMIGAHQGQSAKYLCPICTACKEEVNNGTDGDAPLRDGPYSNENMSEKFRLCPACLSKAEKDKRRDECKNIPGLLPLLRRQAIKVAPHEMHSSMNSVMHVDGKLAVKLDDLDADTERKSMAVTMKADYVEEKQYALDFKKEVAAKIRRDRRDMAAIEADIRELAGDITPDDEDAKRELWAQLEDERTAQLEFMKKDDTAMKQLDEYVSSLEEAIACLEEYLKPHADGKTRVSRSLGVLLLDESIHEVTGISMKKHFGGRTLTHKDALLYAIKWPEIRALFLEKIIWAAGDDEAGKAYVAKEVATCPASRC